MLDIRSNNQQRFALAGAVLFWSAKISLIVSILALSSASFAQNRVDLDDLNIKGELLNDNRLRLSARDPHKMAERVNYRENFRPEIIDGLEIQWPENKNDAKSESSGDQK